MSRLPFLVLLLCAAPGWADWAFDPPITVSAAPRPDVFHHLEAAGRRTITSRSEPAVTMG